MASARKNTPGGTIIDADDPLARLAETERRLVAMSLLLQDKCEDVIDLTAKVEKLEREVQEWKQQAESAEDTGELTRRLDGANQRNEELSRTIEEYEKTNRSNRNLISELQRRQDVLAVVLEERISQQQQLEQDLTRGGGVASLLGSGDEDTSSSGSLFGWKSDRKKLQTQLAGMQRLMLTEQTRCQQAEEVRENLQHQLQSIERSLETTERTMREWEAKFVLEADQLRNAKASMEAYESKLKAVEKGAKDNLEHQGRLHRRDKETLRKLNKKIEELQFLLDERDDDDSDSGSFEDSSESD